MGNAIGHRIQDLAQLSYLILFSGPKSIEQIGRFANDQQPQKQIGKPNKRDAQPVVPKVQHREQRADKNTSKRGKMCDIHRSSEQTIKSEINGKRLISHSYTLGSKN